MTNYVTVNGNTYNDGSVPPGNFGNDGHRTNLIPMMSDAVVDLAGKVSTATAQATLAAASAASAATAASTSATSATSLVIGLGSKSFTLAQTGKTFAVGQWVVIASSASPDNWMAGNITAFNSGTGAITVNTKAVGGSGTFAAWSIAISGPIGSTGVINELLGNAIASASTLDLSVSTGNFIHVTGTVPINAITLPAGAERVFTNDSSGLQLINSANLRIPGNANVTLDAGSIVIARADASGVVWLIITSSAGSAISGFPYMLVREQQTSGTSSTLGNVSGTAGNIITSTIPINTVVTNSIAGSSIASNTITLPAGSYEIHASYHVNPNVASVKPFIYNSTSSSDLLIGQGSFANNQQALPIVIGKFTLSVSSGIQLRNISQYNGNGTATFGSPASGGKIEVYGQVEIRKVG